MCRWCDCGGGGEEDEDGRPTREEDQTQNEFNVQTNFLKNKLAKKGNYQLSLNLCLEFKRKRKQTCLFPCAGDCVTRLARCKYVPCTEKKFVEMAGAKRQDLDGSRDDGFHKSGFPQTMSRLESLR